MSRVSIQSTLQSATIVNNFGLDPGTETTDIRVRVYVLVNN